MGRSLICAAQVEWQGPYDSGQAHSRNSGSGPRRSRSGTNVDLRRAVREGRFRDDLFFRLNVFPTTHLPPLRERRDDVLLLISHFLQHYGRKRERQVAGFTQTADKALLNYDYPGNIRELQNLIERAEIVALEGSLLEVRHLFTSGETVDKSVLSIRPDGRLVGAGIPQCRCGPLLQRAMALRNLLLPAHWDRWSRL